jgi:hypothetical protein
MRRIGDVLVERQVSIEPKLDCRGSHARTFSPTADFRLMIGQRITAGGVRRRLPSRRQCQFRPFFRGHATA